MVDVTPVLTGDLPEFSARRRLRASGIDPRRTFIEKVKAFPTNIEAKVLMTYRPRGGGRADSAGRPDAADRRRLRPGRRHRDAAPQPDRAAREADAAPALRRPRRVLLRLVRGLRQPEAGGGEGPVHHAMAAGEEGPQGRGLRAEEADRLLHRPRGARRSTAPGSRRGSRPGSRRSRRPASRTPSSARSRPPPQEDPDWDAEDARYSSIRWLPSTIENAYGPARPRPAHRRDPRGRHPDVSQYPQAGARLVLRPGLAQRPQGADAARCPTT